VAAQVDRKALIRQYKETRRPMGIFRIVNTVSGRVFIGTSVDLPSVLNRNRAQLRLGGHPNRELQKDWNELGADAFLIEIADTLKPPEDQPEYNPADELKLLESMWRERLAAAGTPTYDR
jgi:hypothetical protein